MFRRALEDITGLFEVGPDGFTWPTTGKDGDGEGGLLFFARIGDLDHREGAFE
jgi:hypothetical protein